MAKLAIRPGSTSQVVYVFVPDSASTTGGGKTGIAFNAASFTAYYVRVGAAATAITLATQTATGGFSSGGWVEVDATNVPGLYRFDVPDAAIAAGVRSVVIYFKGASGMAPTLLEIDLSNQSDAVSMSGTGLTARDIGASVLLSPGTGTGQISITAGAVTAGTVNDKTGYSLNLAQTGLSPRDLGSVADAALTVGDALVSAISAAAGKENVTGTSYVIKTPSTGTTIRTFTLDSATAPTSRT